MYMHKIFFSLTVFCCVIFAQLHSKTSDPAEWVKIAEEKAFNRMLKVVSLIVNQHQSIKNPINVFGKEVTALYHRYEVLRKFADQMNDARIKEQIKEQFKEFFQTHVFDNEKLIAILKRSGSQKTSPIEHNEDPSLMEDSFPLFVSQVIKKARNESKLQEYLRLCENNKKNSGRIEGGIDSDGDKYVEGGVTWHNSTRSGVDYSVDISGGVKEKDGKTKAQGKAKVEVDF